jgi:PEGA domain
MDSQPFDPSCDPFLEFTSEIPIVATQDSEPAFMRTPTSVEEDHSIALLNHQGPSRRVSVLFVATVSVMVGLLAGFAAGYASAQRTIVPAAVSTTLGALSSNSQTPVDAPSKEAAPRPNVVAPALPTDQSAGSGFATQSSMMRRSTSRRRVPATMATTRHAGTIEVLSRPRDAQVLLDGNVIGRAPLSIPEVAEGTHEVRIELAGFIPLVTSVHVKDGSRARVGASLEVEGLK